MGLHPRKYYVLGVLRGSLAGAAEVQQMPASSLRALQTLIGPVRERAKKIIGKNKSDRCLSVLSTVIWDGRQEFVTNGTWMSGERCVSVFVHVVGDPSRPELTAPRQYVADGDSEWATLHSSPTIYGWMRTSRLMGAESLHKT